MGELEHEMTDDPPTPLARLRAGNERFLDAIAASPNPEAAVGALSEADPYAIVLGCSDSRVPPELVFDEAIGRLFVIRVAANLAGNAEIAAMEFAIARWSCPLVVVLGHTQCGAVAAAMETPPPGTDLPADPSGSTHLPTLLGLIRANLGWTGLEPGADPWRRAVRANVRRTIDQLLWSMPLRGRLDAGQLAIVGAVYDVETGEVEFLGG